MGLFDRILDSLQGKKDVSGSHVEGLKRVGEEVYRATVELADSPHPRVQIYLTAAKCFQVMGDALLVDVLPPAGSTPRAVPAVTEEQAQAWFERIPDLLVAARQEAQFADGAKVSLPIRIGRRINTGGLCPASHLAGMRRAADGIEAMCQERAEQAKAREETFKEVILLFEEARTRRQVGDAIVGSLMNGQHVAAQSHEEAEDQYWRTLDNYLNIAQGLLDPNLMKVPVASKARPSRLESDNVWKVTSPAAMRDIRESGEWGEAERDLQEHWREHRITNEEREFDEQVQELLEQGRIRAEGYWYCCPFAPVYRVAGEAIHIIGKTVPAGHVFVWDYGDEGGIGHFFTRSSFTNADSRHYCAED